ncbi:putative cathepsin b endopeptidase ixodes scapularis cathepsin b endopeptidase [Trichostrongylus colubriformis]|uniref:Cathepsin b endopeptidase ixodes scapularis cathepsin b endopeptidase n=1 Tax=Trichostrongylus colubriformis TaxID=6319 RepID=A0AAN8IFI1_TRICO
MKYCTIALCICLFRVAAASEADVLAALKAEKIPLEAQLLTGEALVKYLRENQKFFKVGNTSKYKGTMYKVMNAKFLSQNRRPPVENEEDSGDDIPERCDGGWPIKAFHYFKDIGVVTGGNYGTKGSCRPYEIHPCGHHGNETYYGECTDTAQTPKCKKRCVPGYKKSYAMDKFYGKSVYEIPHSVKDIQKDIMKNGPVAAGFYVYADFYEYTSGIYKHTAGPELGGHVVKVIGWGKEGDIPYWIIANSWHSDWGENGYFRMIRGINNCGIEEHVVAGLV